MARPKKHTDEVIGNIICAIEKGLTLKASCRHAGVSYSSLANWMYKGKQSRSKNESNLYTVILDMVDEASHSTAKQHRERFFCNLSARDFRYGWSNPMTEETRSKLREARYRNKAKRIASLKY